MPQSDKGRQRIVMLQNGQLYDCLSGHHIVDTIMPGQGLAAPDSNVSYIVIDERGLDHGPWGQVLTTSQTKDFQALFTYIQESRQNGTILILIRNEAAQHFSHTLESLADITFDASRANLAWEDDLLLPVYSEIRDYLRLESGKDSL